MNARSAWRKKWLWRVVLLALPPLVFALVFARLKTWRPRPVIKLKGQSARWMDWTPDSKKLALLSGAGDATSDTVGPGHLSLWRVEDSKQLWSKSNAETPCAMLSDGRVVATDEGFETVIFNDKGELLDNQREGSSRLATQGNLLAQGDNGRSITLWDLTKSPYDSDASRSIGSEGQFAHALAFSPDGKLLASSDFTDVTPKDKKDNPVYVVNLWDVKTGRLRRRLRLINGDVSDFAFSPDNKQVAVRTSVRLEVWDVTTFKRVRTVNLLTLNAGFFVRFSPDGRFLAGDEPRDVKLFDARTGALKRTCKPEKGSVTAFAFSPDSTTLALGSSDGTVTMWRLK